jgi:subtilisin-like proprotein convertase family protein
MLFAFTDAPNPFSSVGLVQISTFITHPSTNDLVITLIAPSGATVILSNMRGGGSALDFSQTVFDDLATANVTTYAFTGGVAAQDLQPEQPLSSLRGQNFNGVWILSINNLGPNTGSFGGWFMEYDSKSLSFFFLSAEQSLFFPSFFFFPSRY